MGASGSKEVVEEQPLRPAGLLQQDNHQSAGPRQQEQQEEEGVPLDVLFGENSATPDDVEAAMSRDAELRSRLQNTTWEDYEVLERIGVSETRPSGYYGSNSAVFKVRLKSDSAADGPFFALKLIMNFFGHPAEELAQLNAAEHTILTDTERMPPHGAIVRVYHNFVLQSVPCVDLDLSVDLFGGSALCVIQELLDKPLNSLVRRMHAKRRNKKSLCDEAVFARLMVQVLGGIDHLNSRGVVHRDVKLDNILATDNDLATARLKLVDFGHALDMQAAGFRNLEMPFTQADPRAFGAPFYVAPELQGVTPGPDVVLNYAKSDCFAAGKLAFQLLAGLNEDPYKGGVTIMKELPNGYSDHVRDFVKELLMIDPDQRPGSHVAFQSALKLLHEVDPQVQDNSRVHHLLQRMYNTKVHIGIIGNSGVGKSTLINTLRGLPDKGHPDCAEIGIEQTTTERHEYPYPLDPRVVLVDLPGAGTVQFPRKNYRTQVKLKMLDMALIVYSSRNDEDNFWLASILQEMEIPFLFVRTKIDRDIESECRSADAATCAGRQITDPDHPVALHVFELARAKFQKDLKDTKGKLCAVLKPVLTSPHMPPQPLCVSGYLEHAEAFDMPLLIDTIATSLKPVQRHTFYLGLRRFDTKSLQHKLKGLQQKIAFLAVASSAIAAAPIPGVSAGADIAMCASFTAGAANTLGITSRRIKLARRMGEIPGIPKGKLAGYFGFEFVMTTLRSMPLVLLSMGTEAGTKVIPIVGSIVGVILSGPTTYILLRKLLKRLFELATILAQIIEALKESGLCSPADEENGEAEQLDESLLQDDAVALLPTDSSVC